MMKNIRIICISLLMVMGMTSALAQEENIDSLLNEANNGNAKAMNALGVAYFYGEGVETDSVEGAKWFKRSAETGEYPNSYRNWAECLLDGEGVEANAEEGMKWLEKASEAGDDKAIYRLSYENYLGENTAEDYDRAFELAASIADTVSAARVLLAMYLYEGVGTAPDKEGAKIILRQLSEGGFEAAGDILKNYESKEIYSLYELEFQFIPNLIPMSSILPTILKDPSIWRQLLYSWGNTYFDFSWRDIEVETIDLGKGNELIVYTLPEPTRMPLAKYAAIYKNSKTEASHYMTLEKSINLTDSDAEAWMLCGVEDEEHVNYGPFADSPTKANFIKCVKKKIKSGF